MNWIDIVWPFLSGSALTLLPWFLTRRKQRAEARGQELNNYRTEIEISQEIIKTLREELTARADERQLLKQQIELLLKQSGSMQEEINKLQKDYRSISESYNALKRSYNSLDRKYQELLNDKKDHE